MSIGAAIIALAVLVFVHEAGHFVVARAVGMTPRKFYLGFGPPLVKHVRGGVEYGIAAIPLGGYVKIPGMHRPAAGDLRKSLQEADQERLAPELDALDGALDRGDENAAREVTARLDPELPGDRMLQELEWSLAPDAYWRQRAWKKVAVIAAGPLTNVAFAIVLLVVYFMLGQWQGTQTVDQVLKGHPAAVAGLRAGDKVVTVAGQSVTPTTMPKAIDGTHGKPFTLVVVRHGRRITLGPLRAKLDQGAYRIGFLIKGVVGPGQSLPRAVWSSARVVWFFAKDTVTSLAGLVVGHGTRDVSSAVGIVRVTSQAFRQSAQDFIGIVAEISLALALLNLLPLLPLDGGHIVMSVLERVRGRAFSQLTYMRYSAVGLAFFMVLLYLGLRNDLTGSHS